MEDYERTDTQVYRDGKVHLCSEMCSTCVFRPGNLMSLAPGALRTIIDGNLELETGLVCHQTLPYAGTKLSGKGAFCRGFYDRHKDDVPALGLAEAMGVLVEQDPATGKLLPSELSS